MARVVFLCVILAALVFGIQMLLCCKAKRKTVRNLPAYIILGVYVLAAALCLVDLVNGSGGVAIWWIFAFILAIANTVALAADMAAWMVFRIMERKSRMT